MVMVIRRTGQLSKCKVDLADEVGSAPLRCITVSVDDSSMDCCAAGTWIVNSHVTCLLESDQEGSAVPSPRLNRTMILNSIFGE